jgi:Cu-Zn family superoxide dismutase|tara:strand:- start:2875 stop:3399 length:525 start_codon:yes stop_codon:yes gene_type:complete
MTTKYNISYLFCLIFSFSVLSCSEDKTIVVEAEPKSDSNVTGTITFSEDGDQVLMNAVFTGLTPGSHAIHLHEYSDCSSPDGKSTGGHWNPTFEDHGAWGNETGFHRGDIGNFEANENGEATISFETNLWCINCDDETKNIVGKAVIVHQGQDDFVSQPSGAAGSRVSCAGLIQ